MTKFKDSLSVAGASTIGSLVPVINPTAAVAYKKAPAGTKTRAAALSHIGSNLASAPLALYAAHKILGKNKKLKILALLKRPKRLGKLLWKRKKLLGATKAVAIAADSAGAVGGYNIAINNKKSKYFPK